MNRNDGKKFKSNLYTPHVASNNSTLYSSSATYFSISLTIPFFSALTASPLCTMKMEKIGKWNSFSSSHSSRKRCSKSKKKAQQNTEARVILQQYSVLQNRYQVPSFRYKRLPLFPIQYSFFSMPLAALRSKSQFIGFTWIKSWLRVVG